MELVVLGWGQVHDLIGVDCGMWRMLELIFSLPLLVTVSHANPVSNASHT